MFETSLETQGKVKGYCATTRAIKIRSSSRNLGWFHFNTARLPVIQVRCRLSPSPIKSAKGKPNLH